MQEEPKRDDEAFVAEQEEAAAAEAGTIGGQGSSEDVPEADRAVAEGGGGEAEGFEQSEELLVEHASHGDSGPDPSHLEGEPEDPQAADVTYGDADDVESSERSDPEEGHDLAE
jgi:hypothetical protein